MVIESLRQRRPLRSLHVVEIYEEVIKLYDKYLDIMFSHIYQEINSRADHLSKVCLRMTEGSCSLWEAQSDIVE